MERKLMRGLEQHPEIAERVARLTAIRGVGSVLALTWVPEVGPVERLGLVDEKVVWQLLQPCAVAVGVPGIAPHDLRRSCAKMCRAAVGELEQIQLLLGHASVQTTERYLGTKQDLVNAPNDAIKLRVIVQAADI
jgi:hypothetical protein